MEINAQNIAKAISEGKISYYEALNTYKGIREEEINAELRKLGGDPGAPVDGFEGKNSPKEEKVLYLTKDDTYYQNKRAQYNNEAVQAKADMKKAWDNGNYLDAALSFGKGLLAAYRKETTPENMSEAMRQDAGFGTVVKYAVALGAAGAAFASCEYNASLMAIVPISINSSLEDAINALLSGQEVNNQILAAILEKEISNGATLEDIKNLVGNNTFVLDAILNAITEGNNLLTEIRNSIDSGNEAILETLIDIKSSIKVISDLVVSQPDYSKQLEEIKNAIEKGNSSTQDIIAMLNNLFNEVVKNGDTQVDILAKLEEIQNSNKSDGEKLAAMLELLKNIDSTTQDISKKLDEIKDKLDSLSGAGGISKEDINAIIDAIKENGEKIDATNQLLAKMQDQDEKFQAQVLKLLANVGADYTDVLNKILDAVNNGNAKLDDITKLLGKMQNQDLEFQKNVLNAIDKFGTDISNKLTQILTVVEADKDTGKNIEELLNKVLANMDSNTAKIIDAIANIKIEGGGSGNVDLSSVEAMLKELVELTKDNNNALTNIDGKLDVLNITTQAILDKINVEANKNDERFVKVDAFMKEVLSKLSSASGYDDSKLMEVLSKLSNMLDTRLEEILNAIKDHDVHVTVDVTGKVTCECDCGKPHEGILGDLEDALG